MATRGDVLKVRRAVGFAREPGDARVVVLQSTRASDRLPTLIVAPIDPRLYARPFWVPVSPAESGLEQPASIVLPALAAIPATRLDPVPTGRLQAGTLGAIASAIAVLLETR